MPFAPRPGSKERIGGTTQRKGAIAPGKQTPEKAIAPGKEQPSPKTQIRTAVIHRRSIRTRKPLAL